MISARSILGIVPGLQATAVVSHNLKAAQKLDLKPKKNMGMKKPIKQFVKTGVGNIVGVSLIRPTATLINRL